MTTNIYQLPLNFDQILMLVRQLSESEKIKLGQELEKELRNQKLSQLLDAFRTNELSMEDITAEVEAVREELHARPQSP
ncbi:hypothetical protein XM38_048570 [Halomicronema hongdechloris C2206]|uniref:Uncharacterized protein n=1 Tax=Halomicronema hongdechloris C2206 TaxID=1641165 RepID=A0A1Z3HUB5_9CYAN|nr:hypothetical protein [Halomicronema hongdechloris]ASC73883.1 hypothetical protein XM38_048570 [Halomicronema hongdechloris C2206]